MKGNWIAALRGHLWVKLVKGDAETLLNDAVAERIALWNIAHHPNGELTFCVSVPDFFRMLPMLRRRKCRTRILRKRGLPFQMARLARRKTFAAGMLGFIVLLYVLSHFVWEIRVEGESVIPEQAIRQAAREEGLHLLQWSPRLADPKTLASKLASRLPDAAWVGVSRKGTSYVITVVDATKPDRKTEYEGPRDLVAKTDAVITKVTAENGRPLVERHDRVKKGQVLVTGWLGDENNKKAVASRGTVMGLVWHEIKIVSPLEREQKTLTGASHERMYWIIGNRALQISGYRTASYPESRIGTTIYPWRVFKWQLPFGIMKEKVMEVQTIRSQLTPEEAKEAGLREARRQLLARSGPDARITSENILHEQNEHGKVVMTVLFEVEQSIAIEKPIVYSS
jgi:similar to stage IV sporulation protein